MRLPSYEFGKDVAVELQEAIEDVRMLLNNGKYTPSNTKTLPSYVGVDGEFVIYDAGATKWAMFYIESDTDPGWYSVQLF